MSNRSSFQRSICLWIFLMCIIASWHYVHVICTFQFFLRNLMDIIGFPKAMCSALFFRRCMPYCSTVCYSTVCLFCNISLQPSKTENKAGHEAPPSQPTGEFSAIGLHSALALQLKPDPPSLSAYGTSTLSL